MSTVSIDASHEFTELLKILFGWRFRFGDRCVESQG